MHYEQQNPAETPCDIRISTENPPFDQQIWFPTDQSEGACITESITPDRGWNHHESLRLSGSTGSCIRAVLETAGISFEGMTVMRADDTFQHTVDFRFAHPETYNASLQYLQTIYPNFKPPTFAAHEDGVPLAPEYMSALRNRIVPVPVRDRAVVTAYESYVPAWTFISPQLFEALCARAEHADPTDETLATRFQALVRATSLGGQPTTSQYTIDLVAREIAQAGIEKNESLELAHHNDVYQQRVVLSLAQDIYTKKHAPFYITDIR